MAVTATTRLPAGWYPDPEGGNLRRWWDGREWTQYTAEFQRPTSIDEIEETTSPQSKRKPRKTAKVAELRALKPPKKGRMGTVAEQAPTPQASKERAPKQRAPKQRAPKLQDPKQQAPRRKTPSEVTEADSSHRSPAERLGRLIAGAAYALPAIRRSRKRRRAHRSPD